MIEYICSFEEEYGFLVLSSMKCAQELIRCKDCRYYGNAQIGNNVALTNFCFLLKDCRREEDFCSRAERKEG